MNHRILYIPIAILFLLSFTDCAKKGTPSGGPRDTIPPVVLRSIPENFSTYFSGNEIEIRFDEYIKLKNINQELIISPPMKYMPLITPMSVSKTMRIRIQDTLKPNTTYTFNFGKSIEDNNEGNALKYYKYVFSTGSYIDSLTLSGQVRDARLLKPEVPTTVMLYEINETFTDSIIYSEKPMYITVTQDTTGVFEFTNLKEGEYLLIALKEKNQDYTFRPKDDKIGFVAQPVTIPTDSSYTLTLFKEQLPYKLERPSLAGKQHIIFGYQGDGKNMEIEPLSESPSDFSAVRYKEESKDTIHYWYQPNIETDSLLFTVKNGTQIDTALVRIRELYRDTLNVTAVNSGVVRLRDSLKLRSTTPLASVNSEKVQVMTADSIFVDAQIHLNSTYNRAAVSFNKTEKQRYRITLFPGALTDFFGKENDTLEVSVTTRGGSDYGTLNLTLENVEQFPVIIQLIDKNYKVIDEDYLESLRNVYFDDISPNEYYLRLIYDENANGKWDTGSFLERKAPERIIYYPSKLDIRANWSLNETFRLKN